MPRPRRILALTNPVLASQWHPTKNGALTPEDVAPGAGRKAWWRCEEGHEWEAVINSRNRGRGCPYCSGDRTWAGYNDIATTHPELIEEWAFDLNGPLLPEQVSAGSNKKAWWRCGKGHEWEAVLSSRADGRGCPYCSGQRVMRGFNDLGRHKVARLWDTAANGGKDPGTVNEGSPSKAHWKCPVGHKWVREVRRMVQGTDDCPMCSGRIIVPGFNSLEALYPDVARQWHPTKNKSQTPDKCAPQSNTKVWWRCENGHEWEMSPAGRYPGRGCPTCAEEGRATVAEVAPHLVKEWDWEKNGDLDPRKLTPGAHWKVHWKCEKGHTWKAAVHARVKGSDCPGCQKDAWARIREEKDAARAKDLRERRSASGQLARRAKPGKSLADLRPDLANQWHPTKNAELKPTVVGTQSSVKVWWRCGQGHEWEATPAARHRNSACPVCGGSRTAPVIAGVNDLASQVPEAAAEWHPEKNGDLTPASVRSDLHKKVWWKCPEGHEYQKPLVQRAAGSGCPYCNKRKLLPGFNDLATTHPDLAAEWDYDRNMDTPQDFLAGSHKKRFWLCGSGHSWEAPLKARAYNGSGCPVCVNATLLVGFNDAATTHPHLVADWDVEANGSLRPQDLMAFSSTRVAWKCASCGWRWETKIAHRASGSGCPGCGPLLQTSGSETRLRDWLSQSGVLEGVVQDKNARLEIPWRTRTWMQVDVLGELAGTGRQVVVEYDGIQWHNNDDSFLRDRDKTVALLGAGILVVRVRENDLGFIDLEDPGLLQLNCEWSYDDGPTVEAASVIEAWLWSQLPADHPLRVGGAEA